MGCALGNQELLRFAFADEFIDEAIGVVNASAPVAVKVLQRLGLADAGVAIAFNVLDQGVDALQGSYPQAASRCIRTRREAKRRSAWGCPLCVNKLVDLSFVALK